MICEAMNFSVMPVAGGLYDQHPDLLEDWMVVLQEKSRYERREQAERERQMKRNSSRRR